MKITYKEISISYLYFRFYGKVIRFYRQESVFVTNFFLPWIANIYTSYIPISFNFLCLHTAPLWERRTNGLTDRPFPWNNNSLCQFISRLHFVESFAIPAFKFSIWIQFKYIYIYIYSIKFTWISYLLILFVDPFFSFWNLLFSYFNINY